jgi:hypothetical protein
LNASPFWQLVEMLKQQPLAPALLHALGCTAGESAKPVVRQRCFLHGACLEMIRWIGLTMIWWTGLAPWQFNFPFPGSAASSTVTLNPEPSTLNPQP